MADVRTLECWECSSVITAGGGLKESEDALAELVANGRLTIRGSLDDGSEVNARVQGLQGVAVVTDQGLYVLDPAWHGSVGRQQVLDALSRKEAQGGGVDFDAVRRAGISRSKTLPEGFFYDLEHYGIPEFARWGVSALEATNKSFLSDLAAFEVALNSLQAAFPGQVSRARLTSPGGRWIDQIIYDVASYSLCHAVGHWESMDSVGELDPGAHLDVVRSREAQAAYSDWGQRFVAQVCEQNHFAPLLDEDGFAFEIPAGMNEVVREIFTRHLIEGSYSTFNRVLTSEEGLLKDLSERFPVQTVDAPLAPGMG